MINEYLFYRPLLNVYLTKLNIMTINILHIILVIIFASLAWWVNETLNKVPVLKNVISVIIVIISILILLASLGILGNSMVIRI